jgi:hypothetical protein
MFIKYNGTNVHALPLISYKAVRLRNKKTGKIRIVQKVDNSQSPQQVHSLRPGWNQFPMNVWKQNESAPSIQHMLKKKIIEVMNTKVNVNVRTTSGKIKKVVKTLGQDDSPVKLKYFDEVSAMKIAKATFNRDMLQEWLDEENRSKVKRVISKQLEPLLATTEKSDDGDFEDFE